MPTYVHGTKTRLEATLEVMCTGSLQNKKRQEVTKLTKITHAHDLPFKNYCESTRMRDFRHFLFC